MMGVNTINAGVPIPGCRNGVPVSKIIWRRGGGCPVIEYSDGIVDGTGWIEGTCVQPSFDGEVTCVEENDNLYILNFDTSTGTYLVYDFNNVDVTGTVTPKSCSNSSDYEVRSAGFFCHNNLETLSRFDVVDVSDGQNNIVSSVRQDLLGNVVAAPSGIIKPGYCDLDPDRLVAVQTDCIGNTSNINVRSQSAIEVVVEGTQILKTKDCNSDEIVDLLKKEETITGFALAGDTVVGQTLGMMLSVAVTAFDSTKVTSLSLLSEDLEEDLLFTINGSNITFPASWLKSMSWGNNPGYKLDSSFFTSLTFNSIAKVSIVREQLG